MADRHWATRAYLAAGYLLPLAAPAVLKRRLARGKEDPDRWPEKLGLGLAPRPDGPLVWLNAVGLGETLALRGLIGRMAAAREDLRFLVTSTTSGSAAALARQMPPRTIHQFLPLDAPRYRRRFLDHFRPDLAVWTEQDLWPGLVADLARRGVPQAVVAARMNAASRARHEKARALYADAYRAMGMVTAQDAESAANLALLGACDVTVTGSLKPAAPALGHDPAELSVLRHALAGRRIWAVAPSHPADEEMALDAHALLRESDPDALLVLAPRFPDRAGDVAAGCTMSLARRSAQEVPRAETAVWLFDTMGELGLVYRLADTALIGGTFGDTEGHSPWEAAILDTAILHGPRTANFRDDFARLDAAGAAREVTSAQDILAGLRATQDIRATTEKVVEEAAADTDRLAADLLALLDHRA